MEPLDYFGKRLAVLTGRDELASRGLLRLLFKKKFSYVPLYPTYEQFEIVFNEELVNVLESLGHDDARKISEKMLGYLKKFQSIITMM